MEQQQRVQSPQRAIKPVVAQKNPVDELLEFIGRAKEPEQWLWVHDRFVQLGFKVPSKTVYEALKRCPEHFAESERNLRKEIFDKYRDYVLDGLTTENISEYERKFMALVQAASFVGAGEILRQKALITLAYKTTNLHIPVAVRERIAARERYHGNYSRENFLYAGYTLKLVNGTLEVWFHPETRDSITRSTAEPKHRVGGKEEWGARRENVPERKQFVTNRLGQLIEAKKHKAIVALSPEERMAREKAAEAERRRKANAAHAREKKEKDAKAGKKQGGFQQKGQQTKK